MAEFPVPVAGSGSSVWGWSGTETAPCGQETLQDTHDDLYKTIHISRSEYFINGMSTLSTELVFYQQKECFLNGMSVLSTDWVFYQRNESLIYEMSMLSTEWAFYQQIYLCFINEMSVLLTDLLAFYLFSTEWVFYQRIEYFTNS